MKKKITILSPDVVGSKMAGTGIRYYEIAKFLATEGFDVTLVTPNVPDIQIPGVNVIPKISKLKFFLDLLKSKTIFAQHIPWYISPVLFLSNKEVIVDLYNVQFIEVLEQLSSKSVRQHSIGANLSFLTDLIDIALGTKFVCSNERQRNLWLGILFALNKISVETYRKDSSLRSCIDLAPMGFSSEEEAMDSVRESMRKIFPSIKKDDFILIWGGGIWNWFDPITLIRAIAAISKSHPHIKLIFPGTKHPNPAVKEDQRLTDSIALSKELHVYNKNVLFNFDWLQADEYAKVNSSADVGVSLHLKSLETVFSYRTRMRSYIASSLPILATEGDYFAEEIRNNELGTIIKYGDVEGTQQAILQLSENKQYYDNCVKNIAKYKSKLTWENSLRSFPEIIGAKQSFNKTSFVRFMWIYLRYFSYALLYRIITK